MARNGRHPKTGRPFWRCRVRNRDRVAEYRDTHPYEPHPLAVMTDAEREAARRHTWAQHAFNSRARSRAAIYAERAETFGTGGEAIIPLRYLWFPVPALVELLDDMFGEGLPTALAVVGLGDVYDSTCRRSHVNFAKADRLLARLGLNVNRLGDPQFSIGPPSNPQRKAVA